LAGCDVGDFAGCGAEVINPWTREQALQPRDGVPPAHDLQDAPLTRVYGNYRDGEKAEVPINGETETRVISRIFETREFGFFKVTAERPLRINFEASPERIAKLDDQAAFANLVTSKKRKDTAAVERKIEEGQTFQDAIRNLLASLEGNGRYMDRAVFEADLTQAAKDTGLKLPAPIKKAIFTAIRALKGKSRCS
jgi:type I restriction enzyme M protein